MTKSRAGFSVVRSVAWLIALLALTSSAYSQAPTPTPEQRGVGVRSSGSTSSSQADQRSREAKPELVLQTGYNNFFGATRLAFSPDGKLLATATYRSSTIKLWETATGRELRDLSTGTQSAMGIAPFVVFSPDSRLLAAAAGDNSVKIWDVTTGVELQSLAGPQGSLASSFGVSFIAFTANGQIVTVSDAIKVWDVASGRELRNLGGSELNVAAFNGIDGGFSLSDDGNQLAGLAAEDVRPLVKITDISSGRQLRTINLPDKEFTGAQIFLASDGRVFFAAIIDNHLKLFDLGGKSGERELTSTQTNYSPIKFTRDGRQLWLVENYTARRWDTTTGQELPGLKLPNSGILTSQPLASISISNDGKRAATGGFDTPTVIWDLETGKQILKMNGRTNMAYKVHFSADGTQLASGGRTRWDLRTGRGLRITNAPVDGMFALPSPDGKLIASYGFNSNEVAIMETPSGRQLRKFAPAANGSVAQRASFSADGTTLVVTYGPRVDSAQKTAHSPQSLLNENQTKIWNVKTGQELSTLMTGMSASDAGFSLDGRVVATLGSMGGISLWDTASGSKLRDLSSSPIEKITSNIANMGFPAPGQPGKQGKGSRQQMPSLAQMPNMADMSAMITNMMGAMSAGTMGRSVTSLAFSPDGRILATGGVESKSNFDLSAMMNAATGKGQKRSKNQPPTDPNDFMKDMKVEAIGQVTLWDVATGQELGALKGHGRGVTQVAFSHDGRWLASAGSDNTIKIWDVAAKTEARTLKGHTSNIESLDFSPDSRLLASASDDGSTFLWDTTTGEHLLTLISLDDGGEWMVVTPQGLFDGTPVSWNQILWRYNQDTFNVAPIEWFFTEFYYPGLLSDIIAGKRPRVSQDVSKKDRRQPVVKLSVPGLDPATAITSRTVKVRVDITDAPADKDNSQGSGARDLRLFRNGSLVKVWHGDVLNGKPTVSLEEEITVTAGPNRITAYAFNRDNVKSKDAQLPLAGADSLKRPGTAYIVAVGVNEYSNSDYNLKYAVADAQDFSDEVRARQTQLGSFARVEVVPLLNADATKANILSVLKRLAGAPAPPSLKANSSDNLKAAQPEDTVIIYFAGHGTAQQQRFYLIPHDIGYSGDRTKLNEKGLAEILAHGISDEELEEAVEGLDAGHLLLVIDACNSGQALEAEEKRRGPMNSKGLAQLAYEKGMYILTAAQSYQAALETVQLGHGLLTYALVEEGLKTAVADGSPADGLVNVREWLDFATDRVPQMQEEKMKEARGFGKQVSFVEGEQTIADPEKRSVQRPRVFYRRELEANPLIVAKP
ncbi:MAG TPA: caspase family protein [Pyrinomonadaceae bacterium]|nr:caspase family protein [Pyrinomonadaceae bacterium]